MEGKLLAHIRKEGSECDFQTLSEHNRATAEYARAALEDIGLGTTAYLAGLIHDAGKATKKFQDYLHKAVEGDAVRGSVNHTFAGVRYILTNYHDAEKWGDYAPLTSEFIAFAAGAHHGLFDCVDPNMKLGFQHRIEKKDIGYDEAIENFFNDCVSKDELDRLFTESTKEIETFVLRAISALNEESTSFVEESCFMLSMVARLIASAVIEGDRRDTAEFMQNIKFPNMLTSKEHVELWNKLSIQVDAVLDAMPADKKIDRARQNISKQCRAFAAKPGGIYRLNVPTGAGKTLSSLRFALAHAATQNKKRIIFTSPLLSILEQNADVIREHIKDDSIILEHHSNVIRSSDNEERLDYVDLLTDIKTATFESPIIITTLFQLLSILFDGKTTYVRRLHALCDSIIVIDEVQTVPSHLLSLFNLAVSFLSVACGVTIVLCSATQPCSEAANHQIAGRIEEMVPYNQEIWDAFRRTKLTDVGSYSLEELPKLAAENLNDADSLLIVCNKKAEAENIYQALPDIYNKFYLSAAMCVAHRRKVLAELQQALKENNGSKKIVCVSTQVIEAGVDISFARVIRLLAGMDSMVQSAGRCNRNGESEELAPVQLVRCAGENLSHLTEIKSGKDATMALLEEYKQNSDKFDDDLTSNKAIEYYYRNLYKNMPNGLQDGTVEVDGRKTTLFSMLSENNDFLDMSISPECGEFCLRQAFKTAGREFKVYDTDTTDAIVPYGEGKNIISKMLSLDLQRDYKKIKELIEQAKPYTVSIYSWQRKQLEVEKGMISLWDDRVRILEDGYYNESTGFVIKRGLLEFKEV